MGLAGGLLQWRQSHWEPWGPWQGFEAFSFAGVLDQHWVPQSVGCSHLQLPDSVPRVVGSLLSCPHPSAVAQTPVLAAVAWGHNVPLKAHPCLPLYLLAEGLGCSFPRGFWVFLARVHHLILHLPFPYLYRGAWHPRRTPWWGGLRAAPELGH